MISNIITGITAYVSTSIDYLVILMLIFGTVKTTKERLSIYLGDIVGTAILVAASLFMAFVLNFVPQEWMLGLLGLIPIAMGAYTLIASSDHEDADSISSRLNQHRNIIVSVAVITIATCGADNIGIYVPLFTQLSTAGIVTVLITFFFMLTIFCYLGYLLTKIPHVAAILDRWGGLITGVVYIALGLYILFEAGTIQHFI